MTRKGEPAYCDASLNTGQVLADGRTNDTSRCAMVIPQALMTEPHCLLCSYSHQELERNESDSLRISFTSVVVFPHSIPS